MPLPGDDHHRLLHVAQVGGVAGALNGVETFEVEDRRRGRGWRRRLGRTDVAPVGDGALQAALEGGGVPNTGPEKPRSTSATDSRAAAAVLRWRRGVMSGFEKPFSPICQSPGWVRFQDRELGFNESPKFGSMRAYGPGLRGGTL
jgi:hypothetical protein